MRVQITSGSPYIGALDKEYSTDRCRVETVGVGPDGREGRDS